MNRKDFQLLSKQRIKDAKVLFKNSCYAASYYMLEYAIECAIKACIAKKIKRYDFPNKKLAEKSWNHDLNALIDVAELKSLLRKDFKHNSALETNWAVVKDWNEKSRYNTSITKNEAKDLHSSCLSSKHGIYKWLKKYW